MLKKLMLHRANEAGTKQGYPCAAVSAMCLASSPNINDVVPAVPGTVQYVVTITHHAQVLMSEPAVDEARRHRCLVRVTDIVPDVKKMCCRRSELPSDAQDGAYELRQHLGPTNTFGGTVRTSRQYC